MFDYFDESDGSDLAGLTALLEGLADDLLESSPDIQAEIMRRVDAGERDCHCGKSTCPVGKAIRKEYARRNANGAGSQLTAAQIKTAVYEGQMKAMHDFAK